MNDVAAVGFTLTRGLRAAGHEARFVDLAKYGARWPYPWKAAAFPVRFLTMARLAVELRQLAPDVVHIHYASQGFLGPLAGGRYVVHCHGSDIRGTSPRSRWGRAIGPALRRAAGVLYATPDLAPWARAFQPNAAFLPGPIDTDSFRPGDGRPIADVLISTRLDAIKGAGIILDAVRELKRIRPTTTFTMVEHGIASEELRSLLGGSARVIPPRPHRLMPELLATHSIFVGQFGLGVVGQAEFEALSSGLPVVARLDADDDKNGPPIVAVDTAGAAAVAIAELLDQPDRRAALGSTGRQWAVDNRSLPVVVNLLLERYAEFGIA